MDKAMDTAISVIFIVWAGFLVAAVTKFAWLILFVL